MPADEQARLRALHDAYVWQVNAAVAAGRLKLAEELADEYTEEALAILCGRPGGTTVARNPQTSWLRRLFAR